MKTEPLSLVGLLAFMLLIALGPPMEKTASATLLAVDLFAAGDELLTLDAGTGLVWLDLTETQNLSFDEVAGDVGGWVSLGFRHATGAEVCDLLATYAIAPIPCPSKFASAVAPGNALNTIQSFLGATNVDSAFIDVGGHFDDGNTLDGRVGTAVMQFIFEPNETWSGVGEDATPSWSSSHRGNFLVRAVPEPSSLLLFAAGLAVMGAFRSKRAGRLHD